MDALRELAVLKYVSAIWKQDVTDILQLQDGRFYLYVLDLLDHSNKDRIVVDTDDSRLLHIKEFLQVFYGESVRLDDYLQFEIALNKADSPLSLVHVKMELAKIAVVLLGIGVLDKNGKFFMDAALQLPVELQNDVLAMIQSVVLPDSAEVVLTDRIEHVLRTDNNSYCFNPPVLNILAESNSTPTSRTPCKNKTQVVESSPDGRTPLRSNALILNRQFHDLSSPFKCLDIRSPSSPSCSPLVDFSKSPQLIQKAVLKQKDLELRKLQEQLSAETLLKEEAQLALRDSHSVRVSQDVEIAKLQKRILGIHSMQESHNELLELQGKYQDREAEVMSVKAKAQALLEHTKILEAESIQHEEEMSVLNLKVKSLEAECSKHKDLLETIKQLEGATKSQEVQLAFLKQSKFQWEEEKAACDRNLKTAREMNKRLQNELEELQAKQSESAGPSGESMDIVVDIQMGELRCQLKEAKQEKSLLEKQLEACKKEISLLKEQIQHDQQFLNKTKEINDCLSKTTHLERDTNVKMKKRMEILEFNFKKITEKLDECLKEKNNYAAELIALKAALKVSEQDACKHKQQLELLLGSSQRKSFSEDRGYDSSICSPDEAVVDNIGDFIESRHVEKGRGEPERRTSAQKNLLSTQMCRSSTSSLQSIHSTKEHFSGVLPNALSCAIEPDLHTFDWDRLSHMSVMIDRQDLSTMAAPERSTENSSVKAARANTPKKREVRDRTNSTTLSRQRKSAGTVKYFPLDPKGPIYPPPLPSTCHRRISGRFLTAVPSTSSTTPQSNSDCTLESRTTSLTTLSTLVNNLVMAERQSASASQQRQRKNIPSKFSSYRFLNTYKYRVSRNNHGK